jgi:hypothetical protein
MVTPLDRSGMWEVYVCDRGGPKVVVKIRVDRVWCDFSLLDLGSAQRDTS